MGGDEFLVILPEIDQKHGAAKSAQRILEAIHKPFEFNDHTLQLKTSVGIAIYPDDAQDVDTLVRNADIAMYRAKDLGGGVYQYYDERLLDR